MNRTIQWSFGTAREILEKLGTIPGPTLECNVGDKIVVHFRNKDFRAGMSGIINIV